jgi:ribosome-binding ATPase YchF (GTP1/OBG family)
MPGDDHFEILKPEELSEAQKKGLEYIQTNILDRYGSTGIQDVLNFGVFDLLDQIVVYPVQDENKYTDQKGNVLPDGILLKRGSNPRQLAYLVHTDIGDNFMHAVDARSKMRIASDYELKDGDIISIITRG